MNVTSHVTEELPELSLGLLPPERRAAALSHLSGCAACREESELLDHGVEALGAAAFEGALFDKLRPSVSGVERFAHLIPELARLFDLEPASVRELLSRVDDLSAWSDGPGPGTSLIPVNGGTRIAGALTALIRIEPGAEYPRHEHAGVEHVLVFQGGYRDDTGKEFWRGETDVHAAGSAHSFVALPGLPCLGAAVLFPDDANEGAG